MYVDFVVAPAGLIGIDTFSFGAHFENPLDGTPSRGFFWLHTVAPEASSVHASHPHVTRFSNVSSGQAGWKIE